MSVFDTILNSIAAGGASLAATASRYKNRTTMEAVVAGCAIIAAADGKIDTAEKQKMIGFMARNEAMKIYEVSEVIAFFNKVMDNFDFDHNIGKGEALNMVARLKDKPEAAQLLVRLCIAIGGADGKFDDDEKAATREICQAVNLATSNFGL